MSRWDTLVPDGTDEPPVPGARRFDLDDPFENRAGPLWRTDAAATENSFGDASSGGTFWPGLLSTQLGVPGVPLGPTPSHPVEDPLDPLQIRESPQ